MQAANLFELKLGPEDHLDGMEFATKGWSGNKNQYTVPEGFDGFRVIGTGPDPTHIFPGEFARRAIGKSHRCPHLLLENVIIHAPGYAKSYALQLGTESRGTNQRRPGSTRMLGCMIVADHGTPTSAVMGFQEDLGAEDCEFWLMNMVEHGFYPHGWGWAGMVIKSCHFHEGPRSECIKSVNRPHEQAYIAAGIPGQAWAGSKQAGTPWVPGVKIVIQDVVAYRYGGTYGNVQSWRGGAFFTNQGAGCQSILMERCYGIDPQDAESPGFAVGDDGRYYGLDGIPMSGHSVGDITVNYSGFETTNKPGTTLEPIMRVLNAKSLDVNYCAFYGEDSKIGLVDIDKVRFNECNGPVVQHFAKMAGFWDMKNESIFNHNQQPVSSGLLLPQGI